MKSIRQLTEFGNEAWKTPDGKIHRLDGPGHVAIRLEYIPGQVWPVWIRSESWYVDNIYLMSCGKHLSSLKRFLGYLRTYSFEPHEIRAALKIAVYHKLLSKKQANVINAVGIL